MPAANPKLQRYFERIEKRVKEAYSVAQKARKKGLDPERNVEIALAKELPEKVQMLIADFKPDLKDSELPKAIRKLERKYGKGNKTEVALKIIEKVIKGEFCSFENKEEKAEIALRIAEAYYTLGLTVAQSEGITDVKIKSNPDGTDYLAVYYSGPIRAAGGTAAAMSILFADYVRKLLGLDRYKSTEEEAKRCYVEIQDYFEKVQKKQYTPKEKEIFFLMNHLPIEINGMPTEDFEVSKYKDLERIETSRARAGVVLVMTDALPLKAKKLLRKVKTLIEKEFESFEDWLWLEEYIELQKKMHGKQKEESEGGISPNYKYLEEMVAGRPVFSHPLADKGFRLRYGRTRITGSEAIGLNPATMYLLDSFLATGTQLTFERPGKGATATPCEVIKGPIVKLKDGSVIEVNSEKKAKEIKKKVEEILFLGDILISYGDFVEHKTTLCPPGWCKEWWMKLLKKKAREEFEKVSPKEISESTGIQESKVKKLLEEKEEPTISQAIKLSESLQIPLHPSYTYFWEDLNPEDLENLIKFLEEAELERKKIIHEASLPLKGKLKKILEKLAVPHEVKDSKIILGKEEATSLLYTLGMLGETEGEKEFEEEEVIEIVNSLCPVKIMPKAPTCIGARMGRPEKGKLRELRGKPQILFPVGREGGRTRSINKAISKGKVKAEFPIFQCPSCGKVTIYRKCEECGKETFPKRKCRRCKNYVSSKKHCGLPTNPYEEREVDIKHYMEEAKGKLEIDRIPELIKGVKGTTSKRRIPERLSKGILRSKHNLRIFKDGTVRFDMSAEPMTHFKPKEIGTSVEKLKELGYEEDVNGEPLEREDQILELRPQDVVLPECPEKNKFFNEPGSVEVLLRINKFIDELLEKFYGLKPYHKTEKREDLVGELLIMLAPHTSAGTVGRVIGFSKAQILFAHPYMLAGCRRDADGDEIAFLSLMDGFLNFSKHYLPDKLGGLMDAPLVITSHLDPTSVDDEVYDHDVASEYPLELYEKAMNYADPTEVEIERVEDRLDKPEQFEGLGYTHPVENVNHGVRMSKYKTLTKMMDKIKKQLSLAEKIRAVDESEVAEMTINKHFLRDIKGNLRKFPKQVFRCIDCNKKYRRVPLDGKCSNCGGKLVLTVSQGTVEKYLQPSKLLAEQYDVSPYLKQTLTILERRINSLFGKTSKQTTLVSHLNS